jgi:ABC-type multidrug transport system ATPase subunit
MIVKSKPVLLLDKFALSQEGELLSLELHGGDVYAVVGKAGSGKSLFLDTIMGEEKPACGDVVVEGTVVAAEFSSGKSRQTPFGVAKASASKGNQRRIADVLAALGLWDARNVALGKLTSGMVVACDLLPVLLTDADLVLIDGQLDMLDPWALDGAFEEMFRLAEEKTAFLIATNRPELAERLGNIIVLVEGQMKYAGTVENLVRSVEPSEIIVEADDLSTVRTMVEPFVTSVRVSGRRLVMQAPDGQEVAARLLTNGYGLVRSVVVKEPSLEEALIQLG